MIKLKGLPVSVSFGWSMVWGAIPMPTLEFKLHSNFDASSSQELMALLTLKVAALEEKFDQVTQAYQESEARNERLETTLAEHIENFEKEQQKLFQRVQELEVRHVKIQKIGRNSPIGREHIGRKVKTKDNKIYTVKRVKPSGIRLSDEYGVINYNNAILIYDPNGEAEANGIRCPEKDLVCFVD